MQPNKDPRKMTRDELISEVVALRRRAASSPREAGGREEAAERRAAAQREACDYEIEFIGDFEVLQAKAVDISQSGIGFTINQPLVFEMRLKKPSGPEQYRADLMWVRGDGRGGSRLGLQFTDHAPPREKF